MRMKMAKLRRSRNNNSGLQAPPSQTKRPAFRLGRWRLLFVFSLLVGFLGGCTLSSEDLEFKRAEESAKAGKNEEAFKHYKVVVDRYVKDPLAIRSAQQAARLAHYELKKFPDAIIFYKHIILYAPSDKDRLDAQRKIADLYFSETLDYTQAIAEYSRLIETPHTKEEDGIYRFAIARSYFYLNNFYQATVEIDKILATHPNEDFAFDALLLKSNIYLTTKKLDDAIVTLKELLSKYPVRSKKETIGLVLAICYEEQKNFAKAVETLTAIKDDYPRKGFIEAKIKALKERQSLLPGAKGLHK
jgi:tetratricopeptide (TPR) repeat protein